MYWMPLIVLVGYFFCAYVSQKNEAKRAVAMRNTVLVLTLVTAVEILEQQGFWIFMVLVAGFLMSSFMRITQLEMNSAPESTKASPGPAAPGPGPAAPKAAPRHPVWGAPAGVQPGASGPTQASGLKQPGGAGASWWTPEVHQAAKTHAKKAAGKGKEDIVDALFSVVESKL